MNRGERRPICSCGSSLVRCSWRSAIVTIIVTALPNIAKTFGVTAIDVSITISIYLMVQAILLPTSNWACELFGTRRVFAAAVLLFTLSSFTCGFSENFEQFVTARVIQGAAIALMTPVSRIVLVRSTRREDLVSALTVTTIPMLMAPTLGPPLGGFIVSYLSWPWVFFLSVPIGLICLVFIPRVVPDLRADQRHRFDIIGFVLTGVAIAGLIYGLDRITAPEIDRTLPITALLIGLVTSMLAVRHLLRATHPLLSLGRLRFQTFQLSAGCAPWGGVGTPILGQAKDDQAASAGRLMRGLSLNAPIVSSVI